MEISTNTLSKMGCADQQLVRCLIPENRFLHTMTLSCSTWDPQGERLLWVCIKLIDWKEPKNAHEKNSLCAGQGSGAGHF